ncbi:MAG: nucleotide sugar dehydrogenase [Oscillospiraceae bacterium]|nr:nucleotide sugar dehydrogenase [Oscillospiraceae bacterium]
MVITVFGLGFVGLTTALGFAEIGHKVYGVEVNQQRFDTISSGKLPFLEPGMDEALTRHLNKNFIPCTDLKAAIAESDCVYYCVGTPYGEDGQADLTYLYKAVEQTLDVINDDKFRVLVTKSTIPPSTTSTKIIPFVEEKGFKVGEKLGVANNPEFLREGYCWDDFMNADRIVLGVSDKRSEDMLRGIYTNMDVPVFCVSLNTGEFIKYLSNTLLATLISYSNEMSVIADTIGGIDTANAFRILHMDKRWGGCNMTSYVYPGCGYGGYCLPKDTNALYAVTKTAGFDAQILKNVIATNDSMPAFITDRIVKAAGDDKNVTIGILGLSFKPESDDTRDAPSAKIIRELNSRGYKNIIGYDPVAMPEFRAYYKMEYSCADSYADCVKHSDILVIATAWKEFANLPQITDKPIVDCRYML